MDAGRMDDLGDETPDGLKKIKRTSLPFPSVLRVQLIVKLGEPLGKTRSPIGNQEFDCCVSEGFDILHGKVSIYCQRIAEDYNSSNEKLSFQAEFDDEISMYLKPAATAKQTEYILLTPSNLVAEMQEAWRYAALRATGQAMFVLEIFVYGRRVRTQPLNNVDINQKRKKRLQESGQRTQISTQSSSDEATTDSYRNVRIKLNGSIVEVSINVQDIIAALGLTPSHQ